MSFDARLAKVSGRRRVPRPVLAERAIAQFVAADADLVDARERRGQAFELLVGSGMCASEIARATGLTRTGVAFMAREAGLELMRAKAQPARSARQAVGRVGKPGSVLFG